MDSLLEVFLLTPNLGTSRTFYEEVLGLTPLEESDSFVVYESDTCRLKLQQDYDPDTFADFNLEEPPGSGRGSGAFLVLQTARPLDEIRNRLEEYDESNDAACLVPPGPMPWADGPVMFVRDPNGYTFELRGSA